MTDASHLVHQGLDGWLFLTGGTNFVTTLYQRNGGHLPDAKLARWHETIIERKKRCDDLGVAYAHLVAPEKLTIYGHKLSAPLVDVACAPAIRLADMLGASAQDTGWVDVVGPMQRYRDDVDLYWRTDTHWTPEGCLIAYKLLCDALGLSWNADLPFRPHRAYNKVMDLGGKLTPPVWENVREFHWTKDSTRVYANEVLRILETPAFGGEIHVGSHALFVNERAPNGYRMLLFGDSFAAADPLMLSALLAETVRELEFVWSANVDWGLVRRVKPDILVTQIAERYMALPPNDRFSLRRTEIAQVARARRRRFATWRKEKIDEMRGRFARKP